MKKHGLVAGEMLGLDDRCVRQERVQLRHPRTGPEQRALRYRVELTEETDQACSPESPLWYAQAVSLRQTMGAGIQGALTDEKGCDDNAHPEDNGYHNGHGATDILLRRAHEPVADKHENNSSAKHEL
jgi:hypothetical protein